MIFCFFFDYYVVIFLFFFFQAEDGIRDYKVTGVQTCALPICRRRGDRRRVPHVRLERDDHCLGLRAIGPGEREIEPAKIGCRALGDFPQSRRFVGEPRGPRQAVVRRPTSMSIASTTPRAAMSVYASRTLRGRPA